MLVAMAGLPGAGKSAVAAELAHRLPAMHVAVDPIEDAMLRAGLRSSYQLGLAAYVAAEAIAEDNLAAGSDVIIDAVNDHPAARDQWRHLAERVGTSLAFVEVVCSDRAAHRTRLLNRTRPYRALPEPSWESLASRGELLTSWADDRIVVDSADDTPAELADAVLRELGRPAGGR